MNRPELLQRAGTLVLVGAGKMGGALLEGWLALGVDPARIVVMEPEPTASIEALSTHGLRVNPDAAPVCSDAIVIAVKPQTTPEVMPQVASLTSPSTVVVSIMAGRTIAFLADALPRGAAIIRAMPNTPASIGRGITVAVPNSSVTSSQQQLADALLMATGAVEWIADESLMDAVTAVSGSGPAYVFLLAESLARAAEKVGLPLDLAARLARATIAGSGELLHRSSADAAILRQNVTSPGGTTAAALDVLMAPDGLDPLMERAVVAATRRGREHAG
ncbi:MAG TPA: pyrroline-5-carboxylate reductase [Xanthobacteraceae bacterium]|nr:pyrroline-5-carboxylate reductase [Xanthobacteraceae bacterium]